MKKYLTCALTGKRELLPDFKKEYFFNCLELAVEEGARTFLCGMAKGFDLLAAQVVLEHKDDYDPPLKVVACIPCLGQERYFSEEEKEAYYEVLNGCSEKIVLSNSYFRGCMLARDRYMVDNSDFILAYMPEPTGGTFYTVSYAASQNKKIILV